MSKTRGWCATVYETEMKTFEDAVMLEVASGKCEYAILGEEVCPDTGRDHLQCYLEFKSCRALGGLRKTFGPVHFEARKGTRQQATNYCMKEGKFREYGTRPAFTTQGTRTDLISVKELVASGKNMYEIVDEIGDNYQAIKHAETLMKYKRMNTREAPTVKWFWGRTGTGKTYTAVSEAPGDYWISTGSLQWWQGYEGEEYVILDDFRPSHVDFATLLRWLDKYVCRVPVKGGSRLLCAKTIVITSCSHPVDLFQYKTEECLQQLTRRLSEIREFTGTEHGDEVEGNTIASTSLGREVAPDRIYEIQECEYSKPGETVFEIPSLIIDI